MSPLVKAKDFAVLLFGAFALITGTTIAVYQIVMQFATPDSESSTGDCGL
jgi:hypothetical protein